jgi:arylsulfatase A-like enzyme
MHLDTIRILRAAALALAACAPCALGQSVPHAAASRAARLRLPQPGEFNVLLIVLDDLGTETLAAYVQDPGPPSACAQAEVGGVPTPRLDQLAADGVLFTRCYVNPTCSATRAAVMTGRYGRRTGVGMMINPGDVPGYALPAAEVCLPELIRDASLPTSGTRCAAFGKWHLARAEGDDCHPANSGFERFQGTMGNPASHYAWRKVTSPGLAGCSSDEEVEPPAGMPPTESVWDAGVTRADAAAWIGALGSSERFFAYVAFSPPHAPWEVPPYRTLSARTRARLAFQGYEAGDEARDGQDDDARLIYRANVEALDFEVGALLDSIPSAVLARTLVLVLGDNGTPGPILPSGLEGHGKRSLQELGTRVPLIAYGPLAAAGGVCRELVGAADVYRTAANALGLGDAAIDAALSGAALDGRSFLRALQDPAASGPRTRAYFEAFRNGLPVDLRNCQRGMTDGHYRYLRTYLSDGVTYREYLFHTETDPCESTNLLPATPGSAAWTAWTALKDALDAL